MQFLISVFYLAVFIDPDQRVYDFVFVLRRWFVDADIDGKSMFLGGSLEAQDKRAAARGLD